MYTNTWLTLKSSVITLSVFSALGAALWPWLHIPWKCTPAPTHSLMGITSQLLSQRLSAVVLKQPSDQRRWQLSKCFGSSPLVTWPHLSLPVPSKTAQLQGILTRQPTSLGLRLPQSKWLALGLGLGLCLEASSLVMPGTLVWSNSSSMPFWALPAGGYRERSFAWWWPLSSSLPWEEDISTTHSSFFHISSALCVPFPVSP